MRTECKHCLGNRVAASARPLRAESGCKRRLAHDAWHWYCLESSAFGLRPCVGGKRRRHVLRKLTVWHNAWAPAVDMQALLGE
eukprot:9468205-Pyramimonas_sp.AAC.1